MSGDSGLCLALRSPEGQRGGGSVPWWLGLCDSMAGYPGSTSQVVRHGQKKKRSPEGLRSGGSGVWSNLGNTEKKTGVVQV